MSDQHNHRQAVAESFTFASQAGEKIAEQEDKEFFFKELGSIDL